ncbi:MAG: asparagine synthase [Theionarchaea archaeon DG-70-1]|nr:MAG: asparagine synthase [Theionarchaea archaeon DG-70-1]
MSGIAGIAHSGKKEEVGKMLDKIVHRGKAGRKIIDIEGGTIGVVWTTPQKDSVSEEENIVRDSASSGHFAQAQIKDGDLLLMRDPLGVAPLYYSHTRDGLCFAPEVKSLLEVTRTIHEFPPGCKYNGGMEPYFCLEKMLPLREPSEHIAKELRKRLATSVKTCITSNVMGTWLSGGLDSSALAALASPHVDTLHTFAAGLCDAPDLEHAQAVADFIGSTHHEVVVTLDDLLSVLSKVIYHLESFDALLVRSSMTNYLAAEAASQYVSAVFSGEGSDELFAGYSYLKSVDSALLADELLDIIKRLHNTALQRVDRCASAHSTVAHLGFLDPEVVSYALQIPHEYKLCNTVEKWILRRAMHGSLPERVLTREKAKFWEGAGVSELVAQHANSHISDEEFRHERYLPNGWELHTKEELMYYRIFCEEFGELEDLSWMGRTKGAPRQ